MGTSTYQDAGLYASGSVLSSASSTSAIYAKCYQDFGATVGGNSSVSAMAVDGSTAAAAADGGVGFVLDAAYAANRDLVLCITEHLERRHEIADEQVESWLFVLAGAMVFIMQLGFAMLCAGSVRRKNVSNTLLKNILDAAISGFMFFAIGYALAFGGDDPSHGKTFVGTQNFFMIDLPLVEYGYWFYQWACSAATVTIIAGTLAERCQMAAYLAYACFMTAFVYPVVAHAMWSDNGFLSPSAEDPLFGIGAVDFAGSGVVHLAGGTTALVAAIILGPRKGRFYDSTGEALRKPREIAGHSVSLQTMGVLTLWFGWYGFNAGSSLASATANKGKLAALTAINTSLGAGAGALSAMITNICMQSRKGDMAFDLSKTLNGALTGLVAITAGAGVLEPWAALFLGVISGWVYLSSSKLLIHCKIDDAVDAVPVHMFGGILGLIGVGFLASPNAMSIAYENDDNVGFFYSLGEGSLNATLLAAELVAILFIVAWNVVLMYPYFLFLNYIGWLRTGTLEEIAGLDAAYQVAVQEDNDELKTKIREEFRVHKKKNEAKMKRLRSTDASISDYSKSDISGIGVSKNSGIDLPRNSSLLEMVDEESGVAS